MSSVAAARKVSPNWPLQTMTCHSSHCFSIVWGLGKRTIGDFSSEQLLHDPIFYALTRGDGLKEEGFANMTTGYLGKANESNLPLMVNDDLQHVEGTKT